MKTIPERMRLQIGVLETLSVRRDVIADQTQGQHRHPPAGDRRAAN